MVNIKPETCLIVISNFNTIREVIIAITKNRLSPPPPLI